MKVRNEVSEPEIADRWPDAERIWVSQGSHVYCRRVAGEVVKVLVPMPEDNGTLETQDDMLTRHAREIAAATAFARSPYGLPVLDSGVHQGLPYIVTPYVDGQSLEEVLVSGKHMTSTRRIKILRQLAEAVAMLHRFGYFHCDLKPSNVLLRGNELFLIDFGGARPTHHVPDRDEPVLYSTGYTAPECFFLDAQPSPAQDLYSLGMIAHEVLSGRHPFFTWEGVSAYPAQSPIDLYLRFTQRWQAPSLSRYPILPAAAAFLLDRCLSVDPRKRPGSAEVVACYLGAPYFSMTRSHANAA